MPSQKHFASVNIPERAVSNENVPVAARCVSRGHGALLRSSFAVFRLITAFRHLGSHLNSQVLFHSGFNMASGGQKNFDPDKDIGDLRGKVIVVTGGE